MLTKDDLQNIDDLIERKFDQKLEPLKKDIKKIKTDVAQTRKDINMVIGVFDNDNTKLRQRVEVIEDKVGIRH